MENLENEAVNERNEAETELEAAADSVSADKEDVNINEAISYVVPLTKGYMLEGKEIREVDLSGLEDLSTQDAQDIDRVMAKMKHHPQGKFQDILYTKHIAMRATGLPIEFFNTLKFKDMQAITSRVAIYFLY